MSVSHKVPSDDMPSNAAFSIYVMWLLAKRLYTISCLSVLISQSA